MQIKNKTKSFLTVFTSFLLLITTISCDNPTTSNNGNNSGELVFPADVGYGPYTSPDLYITVEATEEGLVFSKIDYSNGYHYMIDMRRKDYPNRKVARPSYSKNLGSEKNLVNEETILHPYVEKDGIYAIRLLMWDEDWSNYKATQWVYVKAKNGKNDMGTDVYSKLNYNKETGILTISISELIHKDFSDYFDNDTPDPHFEEEDWEGGSHGYSMMIYYPDGTQEWYGCYENSYNKETKLLTITLNEDIKNKINTYKSVEIQLNSIISYGSYYYEDIYDELTGSTIGWLINTNWSNECNTEVVTQKININ